MDLGPHAFFIIAAYAMTALVVGALVVRAWAGYRMQVRALTDLETRGVKRRSGSVALSPLSDGKRSEGQAIASRSG